MGSPERTAPVIPDKLAAHTDANRILENARNYPEMQRHYTPGEQMAAIAIQKILLDVDLTHGTRKPFDRYQENGILPESLLAGTGEYTHTKPLYRALSLNEYVFMHWGNFSKGSGYGRNIIGINTRNTLLSDHAIVTPYDIVETVYASGENGLHDLKEKELTEVDLYLSRMVTGKDWLDIISK